LKLFEESQIFVEGEIGGEVEHINWVFSSHRCR
jgi:hypothetical protein